MELSFVKEGSRYISEFKVSSDFNLHIERDKGGYIFLYQRSSEGGEYDSVGDSNFAPQDLIIDYDCSALVYPKTIKIVSEVEPTYASLTTSGEVTEIKSQSKEIEVTSNGTTEVTPDAGFSYLNSVKVKTNVAGSGGGGGSASGENDYEYIDVRELGELKPFLVTYALAVRIKGADYYTMPITSIISNTDNADSMINATLGVMIDTSFMYDLGQDGKYTISEMCSLMGVDYASLPRITKEEFYNLNA